MLCPNCESENRDGAKFCDECGFPLTGAIAARAAEVAGIASEEPVSKPKDKPAQDPQPEPISEAADVTAALDPIEEGQAATENLEAPSPDEKEAQAEPAPEPEVENIAVTSGIVPPDVTAVIETDFGGLDRIDDVYGETVVGADYQEPKANWRDGHTMQMPRIEDDEAPRSRDFLASSTTKQKTNKKVVIGVIAAVVALAAIIAFATYQMQLWGGKAVPDVRGMTEADATSVLEGNGFTVRSTQVKSDDTEGLVLLMDPTAGSRAGEGSEVVIHIASARAIPDVVGKTEKEAKAAIDEEGYENVSYVKERSDSAEGTVLSISPEVGTRAKSTIAVTVKVAEPYVVPDVSSLSLGDAETAVHNAGLAYDVAYVDTTDYPEGTVLGTDPEAGTKVKGDTVVAINVARARGVQLVDLTKSLIVSGYELELGGTSYIVSSLDSTSYLGNDQVSFTATARPYTVFFGVYVEGDPQQVSGVVTWTADNQVSSIS